MGLHHNSSRHLANSVTGYQLPRYSAALAGVDTAGRAGTPLAPFALLDDDGADAAAGFATPGSIYPGAPFAFCFCPGGGADGAVRMSASICVHGSGLLLLGAINGISAANGLSRTSPTAAAPRTASAPAFTPTCGSLNVPFTYSGERSENTRKPFVCG